MPKELTANRNYPVPHPLNEQSDDLQMLREALGMIDRDMAKAVQKATNNTQGQLVLATPEEVIAGTNTELAATPAGVKASILKNAPAPPDASTSKKGVVVLATQEEVVAGTNTEKVATPAGVKAAISAIPPVEIPPISPHGIAKWERPGTYTWIVPDGVKEVWVTGSAGGGGGGNAKVALSSGVKILYPAFSGEAGESVLRKKIILNNGETSLLIAVGSGGDPDTGPASYGQYGGANGGNTAIGAHLSLLGGMGAIHIETLYSTIKYRANTTPSQRGGSVAEWINNIAQWSYRSSPPLGGENIFSGRAVPMQATTTPHYMVKGGAGIYGGGGSGGEVFFTTHAAGVYFPEAGGGRGGDGFVVIEW